MDDLFAPPAEEWRRLSPKYLTVKRITSAITWGVLFGFATVVVALLTRWEWAAVCAAVGVLVISGWQLWLGRWFERWGYAERSEDIYVSHGRMFRQLTVTPYGRMQIVKVQSGPIERALGLASVELVTASASTNARIPGLPAAEAARLRDRLSELGESRSAGI